jgi:hypothetical protein
MLPMFDKISRSWSLAGQCWDVLKEDPALLLFPLMSSIVMLLILGSFALPVFALYHSVDPNTIRDSATHTGRAMFYLGTYIFYVVSYTVMMFFNSALISVALKRLDGESATVGDGLRAAVENLPAIVGYALVAATVGTILRAIEERVGLIGRIVVALIGAGWTLATAMTLPVLIEEGVGPIDAIARSLELFIMMSAMSGGAIGSIVLGVAVFVLACILVGLVSSTLHSIYTAALYRFATGAKENAGIDGDLLSAAFRPK